MVNLSLNKNEAGVVTLTLEYHESTQMELLFDFIRSQASNAYVPETPAASVSAATPTIELASTPAVQTATESAVVSSQPATVQQAASSVSVTPSPVVAPVATNNVETAVAQVAPAQPGAIAASGPAGVTAAVPQTPARKEDSTPQASSLDDLSDNETATLIALAQLGAPLEEAKDIVPLLHSGGRFKSRSDDHASIVRYLLRTLIAKGLVQDTQAGRELTQLGVLLSAKALKGTGATVTPAPYRWSPED